MNRDQSKAELEQTEVFGEVAYVCPSCGSRPPKGAIAAGVDAPCQNSDCIVNSFRWWEK